MNKVKVKVKPIKVKFHTKDGKVVYFRGFKTYPQIMSLTRFYNMIN